MAAILIFCTPIQGYSQKVFAFGVTIFEFLNLDMAATTTGVCRSGEDRVMAAAQQIVRSLNTPKEVREDMLLIFSNFDDRLSKISDVVHGEDSRTDNDRFEAAEKAIRRWDSDSSSVPRASSDGEESSGEFLSAVDEILDLIENRSIRSDSKIRVRAENAIQLAMSRLEDEFRRILIRNTVSLDAEGLYGLMHKASAPFVSVGDEIYSKFESFAEVDRGSDRFDDVCIDLIHPDAIVELQEIADRMIRAGYNKECLHAYSTVRGDALEDYLAILGVERLSIEEVQKIDWTVMDEKMKNWIQAVKIMVRVLLLGEKRVCDQIFSSSNQSREICFNESARACVMPLMNFGETMAIGKRSPEKLFRILDMYEAWKEFLPDSQAMVTDPTLIDGAEAVLTGLGKAIKWTFSEFENAVRKETSKKATINAEIHPLSRYVMNYLTLLVDYRDALDSLLEIEEVDLLDLQTGNGADTQLENKSATAMKVVLIISSLESNLEKKSKLYDDGSMKDVFLMNNILYIVQKLKDSDLGKLLGNDWIRKRQRQIRHHATSYLRTSWSKVLAHLKDVGTSGSSNNASKMALKEKFKNFNSGFEEIYRTQTAWKVSDGQLREELRISISEKVLPAYRSFVGRFRNQLESGKNSGKYIKYSSEDLENYLLDLFEGSPAVLHHMRRKST